MDSWNWQAAQWTHAPWTLWTSAFVHLSPAHAMTNLAALAALLLLARVWALGARTALAALLAWPLGVGLLACWPAVQGYAGLSGPLHALATVMVVHHLLGAWRAARRWPVAALALGLGLVLKLTLEQGWAVPLAFDPGWDFPVVRASHLSGALAGLACGLLTAQWVRPPAPPPAHP